jgi:hypothetical protein
VFGSPVAGPKRAGDVGCLNRVAGEGGWPVAAVTVGGVAGPVPALLEGVSRWWRSWIARMIWNRNA